ncbi:hypothetical protein [cyanobacterium endosymbiont of Rhopalodia gibberula]|nr:hypothetical protein [cyanobacterium endosymbiont of Rhopalodia gibberula]
MLFVRVVLGYLTILKSVIVPKVDVSAQEQASFYYSEKVKIT